MSVVYRSAGIWGLILFFLPLLVSRHAFQLYMEMRQSYVATVRSLTMALEARDRYTAGHAERVSGIAMALGRKAGMSPADLEVLEVVGLLHDIGKLGVPDHILNKRGTLTPEEYQHMKHHPIAGARIVEGIKFLGKGTDWVRHHHEWVNGQGYPDGLRGNEIALGARVVAVADAADAMLTDRPYRRAMSLEATCQILAKGAGTQFDTKIVNQFLALCRDHEFVTGVLRQSEGLNDAAYSSLTEVAAAADTHSKER